MISNQKLLESLKQYKTQPTEENETTFYEELITAQFLVPIDRTSKEEKMRGKVARFLVIVSQDQENFLPAFTDIHEWGKWPFKAEEAAVIAYDDLRQILTDDPKRLTGISINPFGQNLTLNQKELDIINSRTADMTPRRTEPSVQILVVGEDEKQGFIKNRMSRLKEYQPPC